ncbi:MAG: hypothetical protein PX636_20995 [Microcystis sp. M53598_WE2]|nr:hypothetical protein [Microcystis sp. M53598_WE2]
MNFTIPIENNLLHHHSGDSETPRLRDSETIFIYSPHTPNPTPTPTPHTPHPHPKKRNWEKKF